MNSPKDLSHNPTGFFDDLTQRRSEGKKISIAEESYCWAIENGFNPYIADLMYMEEDGQVLSPAEQAYLDSVLNGASEEDAEQAADQTSSIFPEFEQDVWDEVVRTSRDKFFASQNESEASSDV